MIELNRGDGERNVPMQVSHVRVGLVQVGEGGDKNGKKKSKAKPLELHIERLQICRETWDNH